MFTSGQIIPPHIIFQESFPSKLFGRIGPDRSLYLKSKSGYMDFELFFGCFDRLFIPQTMSIPEPKLLILDGHGSHFNTETVKCYKDNNIHLYCLPPHTMHIFQPLDFAIFHPIKAKFSTLNENLKLAILGSKNPMSTCKSNFTEIFKEVLDYIPGEQIHLGMNEMYKMDRTY